MTGHPHDPFTDAELHRLARAARQVHAEHERARAAELVAEAGRVARRNLRRARDMRLECEGCGVLADRQAAGWRGYLGREQDDAVATIIVCPPCGDDVDQNS